MNNIILKDNYRNLQDKIQIKGSMEEFNRYSSSNMPEKVVRGNIDFFENEYNTKRAKYIAEVITGLPEVEKTTVVITGNSALIGANLASDINEKEVNKIKKTIEEKTLSTDASLKNVSITVSPEVVEKIRDIAEKLNQGRNIDGLAEELGSIIRRITPTI